MEDKQFVLVTGATGAIGKAIVLNIFKRPAYRVFFVARNKNKAEELLASIEHITGNNTAEYTLADLSNKDQIFRFAKNWDKPLHVLINNAATAPRTRQENEDGIELQFATNVLGYHWMTEAFLPYLKKSSPARVVNMASYWAGGLDLDDLEFKNRRYDNNSAYRQSKQADRMLSSAYADLLKPEGISVNACHPGDVNSTISNDLGFGGHESPDEGASTPVWLATGEAGIMNTGKYYEHRQETRCRFSEDKEAVNRLFDICKNYI